MTRWCNRRALAAIVLIVAAGALQGCVYDPYTGTYVPCCAAYPAYGGYGYPGYGYPAYRGYYGAPPAAAYPAPGYQGQGYQGQPYQGGRYQAPPPPP